MNGYLTKKKQDQQQNVTHNKGQNGEKVKMQEKRKRRIGKIFLASPITAE